jgi:GNAT superfamily N-acetyltransferase
MTRLDILPLKPSKCRTLALRLQKEDREYIKYFHPFPFDASEIRKRLVAARKDFYWGIFCGKELVGFFMLRGMDDGYEVPSYGVYISRKWSGKGLSKLSLLFSISWCRVNGFKTLMLKVHPKNHIARKMYEDNGFVTVGVDSKNDNFIMHRTLAEGGR